MNASTKMKKNIWIINEYAGSPYHGMEFRHYYLGKQLIKLDCSVNIISSNYSHLFKNLPEVSSEDIDGINYFWLKTLNYGSSRNKMRILKWFIFSFKIFLLPFKLKKPDVIIVSPMAPFPIFPSWVLAKFFSSKLIYEVKDIWPASLIELGGISPRHPLILVMYWFEKFALKKSDIIVSNLPNYGKYVKDRLQFNKPVEWISNGIDLDELRENESLEKRFYSRIPKNKFVIGYTGSVGLANSLEYFCKCAEILRGKKNICFIIVGNGQDKNNLIKSFGHLDNLIFIEGIPKRQVPAMLDLFDVCYAGVSKKTLYRYGVSLNKIFDYMLSGKPVIYAIDSGEINVIKLSKCGITCEPDNVESITSACMKIYNMTAIEQAQLGENGKRYVVDNFTYEKFAQSYYKLF
ncbi:glycosyltransferase family 4 protein [Amylibacter sp.]|nr:glycosyltransferase family 4 protein [Amylibacter sp.]